MYTHILCTRRHTYVSTPTHTHIYSHVRMCIMSSEVAQLPLLGDAIFFKAFKEIRGVAAKQSYGEWHPR